MTELVCFFNITVGYICSQIEQQSIKWIRCWKCESISAKIKALHNFSDWDNNNVLVICRQLGYSTINHSVCFNSTCGPINCCGSGFPAKLCSNCGGQVSCLIDYADNWIANDKCDGGYIY